jgi:RHS repeat-associated protein
LKKREGYVEKENPPTEAEIADSKVTTQDQYSGIEHCSLDAAARACPGQAATGGTSYLTSDTLGTPRVITGTEVNDENGGVKARHDYLPFGEELFAGAGLRDGGHRYGWDNVRQKFTSQERDDETGLDYFNARYYASAQGRFTAPDPLPWSGIIDDPQTWNPYSYTLNNPLKYTDPTGLYTFSDAPGGDRSDAELMRAAGNDKKKIKHARHIIDLRNKFRAGLSGAAAAVQSGSLTASQQMSCYVADTTPGESVRLLTIMLPCISYFFCRRMSDTLSWF